jgi:hypothetical protein
LADRALHQRVASLAERHGLCEHAVAALERSMAAEEGAPEQRAEDARRAGQLRRDRLEDPAGAIDAFRRALAYVPDDSEAVRSLAALVSGVERPAIALDFERAVRARRLDSDPTDPEALRNLRLAAHLAGDAALEHAVLAALVALDEAKEEERRRWSELHPSEALPGGELDTGSWRALRGEEPEEAAEALVREAFETLCIAEGLTLSALGLKRGDLLSPKEPHPLRDQVLPFARAVGLQEAEVFVGGPDPDAVMMVPGRKERPAIVVGASARAPLDARRRFELGRDAMGMADHSLSFIAHSPRHAAAQLYAATEAAEVPLREGRGQVPAEQTRVVAKAMPRRARRAIGEIAPKLPGGGAELEAYCHRAQQRAFRMGTIAANDIQPALDVLLGSSWSRESVKASRDARDLLGFWLSRATIDIRRKLGLAP